MATVHICDFCKTLMENVTGRIDLRSVTLNYRIKGKIFDEKKEIELCEQCYADMIHFIKNKKVI